MCGQRWVLRAVARLSAACTSLLMRLAGVPGGIFHRGGLCSTVLLVALVSGIPFHVSCESGCVVKDALVGELRLSAA